MNSRTVLMIVALGGLGLLGLLAAAMMGFDHLAEAQPMIRVRVAIADKFQVKEVTLALDPPAGGARTLKLGYATSTLAPSDARRDEMEAVAKFAWEQVEKLERETLRKIERDQRGPIAKVGVHRTWRSDRGCFKRSDQATHEWRP